MLRCAACSCEVPAGDYCIACGKPLTSPSEIPTRLDARVPTASSSPSGHCRFLPGTMLAGRYRIVALLGKGGMGEVYRAEDLKLGQPVALKFLPEGLKRDDARLQRFLNEVRTARQVAHRNVCRVYDVGEVDGHHFISMEYVDGEDLGSLLRRIGRLPRDKGLEIARQISFGLAAAHEAGVLHRDLKPSNVMIDGRGRARITDFGLASLGLEVRGEDAGLGTPAYMAPEQLAGQAATTRSDVYALGLVLYEVFTGKRPFEAATTAELRRLQTGSSPASPASMIGGLDPVVERVILRCLEPHPAHRPPSALAVTAALPGGDPLAAALAAGETPSPEMVAAAGEAGGLRVAAASILMGCLVVGLLVSVAAASRTRLNNRVPLDKAPEALADRAAEIVRRLGHDAPAADAAWGFEVLTEYLRYIRETDTSSHRWDRLASGRPPGIYFWYRQSPQHMVPVVEEGYFAIVSQDDPPPVVPGMASAQLDTAGRLIAFQAIPPERDEPEGAAAEPDWSILFALAGLEEGRFAPVEPAWVPPVYCDRRAAWEGADPKRPSEIYRIEAGAYRGRTVSFRILGPWVGRAGTGSTRPSTGPPPGFNLALILAILGAILLARHNLRLGRGDRAGAFKVAAYFFLVHMIVWAVWVDHVPDLDDEWRIFTTTAGWSLFNAVILWLFYLALEPLVRRRWPEAIISWSRVLTGRFRDPLVGRDILIGVLLGTAALATASLAPLLPSWIGLPASQPARFDTTHLQGARWTIGQILDRHIHAILDVMMVLVLLLILRLLLRKQWLAAGALAIVLTAIFGSELGSKGENPAISFSVAAIITSIAVFALIRFGLLAATAFAFCFPLIDGLPITTDPSAWYLWTPAIAILAVLGLAVYGFNTSLAGRPLWTALGDEALQP